MLLINPDNREVLEKWALNLVGLSSIKHQLTVKDICLSYSVISCKDQLFYSKTGVEIDEWASYVVVGVQSNIMMLETEEGTQLSLEANPGSRELDIGRP